MEAGLLRSVTMMGRMERKPAGPESDREIDFSNARTNPYASDYHKSRNLRVLAPDLLDVFPDSESVNEALRTLVRLVSASPRKGTGT